MCDNWYVFFVMRFNSNELKPIRHSIYYVETIINYY